MWQYVTFYFNILKVIYSKLAKPQVTPFCMGPTIKMKATGASSWPLCCRVGTGVVGLVDSMTRSGAYCELNPDVHLAPWQVTTWDCLLPWPWPGSMTTLPHGFGEDVLPAIAPETVAVKCLPGAAVDHS